MVGTNNGTLSPSGASYAPGMVGQAFRFDGANGYVQVPDSDVLKPANITVEAWVWLDPGLSPNQGGEQIVFKKNTWSAWFEGYSLLKETLDNGDGTRSDHFQFVVSRNGNQVVINSQTIAQRGVWYHVAATYDGNQSVLYVNGIAEASATAGFALDYDTTPLYIGTTGTWAPYLNFFGGLIDEVSIYNRALSSTELAAIYNAGSAGKCPPAPTPPTILTQPVGQTVYVGQTATFSVVAGGTAPLSYQWSLNGTNVIDATNATFTVNDAQFTNAGTYAVQVSNAVGTTNSAGALLAVLPPPPCYPMPSGMVAWWKGEGNANDSISTNNGTLSPSGASYAPGMVGQAFRFDGANGYVQVPDSDALKPANVTVEAWVWLDPNLPPNQGGEQIVFKKNTWSAWFEGYSLLKETLDNGAGTRSDHFQFVVSRNGDQVVINSQTIAQRGVWYHVAATYDGNQSVLYVNGVAEAAATAGFTLDYDTTPLYIGTTGTWAPYLNFFGGIIDEVSVYNRALSNGEIAAIYHAGGAGKCLILPVADPTATAPAVISLNGSNAVVVLDGSKSYDLDGDPLQYTWLAGSNTLIATGVVAVVTLPAGTNLITLGVSDGVLSGSQTLTVTVLTLSQAVEELISVVNQDVARQQPLVALLEAALASIDKSNPISAVNQLQAFQNQLNAQLAPVNAALAQGLSADAQAIIDTLAAGGSGHVKLNLTADRPHGKLHLNFTGASGRTYIIEASSDLVHWRMVGVAKDQGNGTFQFDDSQLGQNPQRFYRLLLP